MRKKTRLREKVILPEPYFFMISQESSYSSEREINMEFKMGIAIDQKRVNGLLGRFLNCINTDLGDISEKRNFDNAMEYLTLSLLVYPKIEFAFGKPVDIKQSNPLANFVNTDHPSNREGIHIVGQYISEESLGRKDLDENVLLRGVEIRRAGQEFKRSFPKDFQRTFNKFRDIYLGR